jgi:hypothetical protein
MEKDRGITITNVDKQKQCDIHVVKCSYVYAHTSGEHNDDGNEWFLHNLYRNKKDAELAVNKYEYNSRVEKMEIK